jgi:4-amino-4-deoxy-L-arabinose transferase-like glycosyltransferase
MLSSSVSNDILAELVFGTALLLMVELLTDRFTVLNTTATGIILAIGCITKATCVILIPIAVVAYLLMWRQGRYDVKTAAGHVLLMLFVAALGSGWWFVRNNVLYGDPLAMSTFQNYFGDTARPEYWFSHGFTAFQYLELVVMWTFASFWGVFGHMNIFMPSWIYITAAGVSLIGIAGSVKGIPEWRRQSVLSNEIWVVFAATFVLVLLAFIRFNTVFFQAQGRYLYPAIVPVAVLWVLGIEGLLPRGERVMSATVIVGFPIFVQAAALVTCVLAQPTI